MVRVLLTMPQQSRTAERNVPVPWVSIRASTFPSRTSVLSSSVRGPSHQALARQTLPLGRKVALPQRLRCHNDRDIVVDNRAARTRHGAHQCWLASNGCDIEPNSIPSCFATLMRVSSPGLYSPDSSFTTPAGRLRAPSQGLVDSGGAQLGSAAVTRPFSPSPEGWLS